MSKILRVKIIAPKHAHYGEIGTIEIPRIAIIGATGIFDNYESYIRVRRDGIIPKWSHMYLVTLESGIQCFAQRGTLKEIAYDESPNGLAR